MIYYGEADYLSTITDIQEEIEAMQAIITALDTLALDLISKGGIKSYSLDDRQVTISRTYGSMKEVRETRLFYTQQKVILEQKITGRTTYIQHPIC